MTEAGLTNYERALRVRVLLRRWEHASRDAMSLACLLSWRIPESSRVNKRPDVFQNLLHLVADVERLLLRMPDRERQVVVEIAIFGRDEWSVAERMGLPQTEVWRAYWRGILWLDPRLAEGGYFGRG